MANGAVPENLHCPVSPWLFLRSRLLIRQRQPPGSGSLISMALAWLPTIMASEAAGAAEKVMAARSRVEALNLTPEEKKKLNEKYGSELAKYK